MTFASLKVILLANLGESDKIAKLQVHGEYSRMGEPTWTKQEPGKRHDCGEKLHHTVGIAAFSVIEIQRRSFIAILTQPRRIRQQYLLKIAAKKVKEAPLSHSLAVVFPSPLLLDLKNLRDWL